jgi:hypothetical protein
MSEEKERIVCEAGFAEYPLEEEEGGKPEKARELTEQEKIAQAVEEGYPDVDETCPKCGTVFKNYHHFILCPRGKECPMSNGKGTILEQMLKADEEVRAKEEEKK